MKKVFLQLWAGMALAAAAVSHAADGAAASGREAAVGVLGEIERQFATVKTVQASFRQEKRLSLFDQTVVIEGTLSLENPDRFAWRAARPVRYSLVMRGADVRQWDEDSGREQRVPVAGNPVFKMATGQMRDWFAGRYAALLADYDLTVLSRDPCRLRFAPKAASMAAKALRSVEVSLRGDLRYLECIRIEDLSGDSTTILFSDVVINEPIDSRAWEATPRD